MPEVITECDCGQLPPLEPARREVDPLTLAACSDPFCAACLEQIAANEEANTYQVEVRRSISVTVSVTAASPEAALDQVNRHDFELPARDDWTGHKDWSYAVYDADGAEVLSADR